MGQIFNLPRQVEYLPHQPKKLSFQVMFWIIVVAHVSLVAIAVNVLLKLGGE